MHLNAERCNSKFKGISVKYSYFTFPSNKWCIPSQTMFDFFFFFNLKSSSLYYFFSLYLQEIKAWNWSLHDMVWASRSFYYTWNDNLFQDRFSLFARRCFGLCEVFSWMTGTRMSSQRLAHPHPEHFKKSLAIYELCLQNSWFDANPQEKMYFLWFLFVCLHLTRGLCKWFRRKCWQIYGIYQHHDLNVN